MNSEVLDIGLLLFLHTVSEFPTCKYDILWSFIYLKSVITIFKIWLESHKAITSNSADVV